MRLRARVVRKLILGDSFWTLTSMRRSHLVTLACQQNTRNREHRVNYPVKERNEKTSRDPPGTPRYRKKKPKPGPPDYGPEAKSSANKTHHPRQQATS